MRATYISAVNRDKHTMMSLLNVLNNNYPVIDFNIVPNKFGNYEIFADSISPRFNIDPREIEAFIKGFVEAVQIIEQTFIIPDIHTRSGYEFKETN